MDTVWIAALLESNRSRWLYAHQDVVRALLLLATHAAKVDPTSVHVVSDDPNILDWAAALGMKCRHVVHGTCTQDLLTQIPDGLVLSPHRGAISAQRVRRVLETAKQWPKHSIVTSPLVPANCHPAWISAVDTESMNGFKASFSLPTNATPHPALSAQAKHDLGLGMKKIPGSQWLPDLHAPDYAITFVHASDPLQIMELHDAPSHYDDLPMLYRLPVFQLHESQYPDLNVHSITQDIM